MSVTVLSSRTSARLAVKHCRSISTSPALLSQRSEVPSVGVSASLVTNPGCSVPRDPSGDRGGSQNLAENFFRADSRSRVSVPREVKTSIARVAGPSVLFHFFIFIRQYPVLVFFKCIVMLIVCFVLNVKSGACVIQMENVISVVAFRIFREMNRETDITTRNFINIVRPFCHVCKLFVLCYVGVSLLSWSIQSTRVKIKISLQSLHIRTSSSLSFPISPVLSFTQSLPPFSRKNGHQRFQVMNKNNK